jgi:hypothetical protein
MRGLCYHYGVELHNFAPNAISQAATFVGVCEGFLGIPVNWDLWIHLFRAELHTVATAEARVHRVVHASGLTFSVRDSRKELYLPCTTRSNNAEWERGVVLPRQRRRRPSPYTGKVLKAKIDAWHHGLSPPSRQDRLESLLNGLKSLADVGLGVASVLANLHHRRIVPLMERELRIFEMTEEADLTALVRSRLLREHFPQEYVATRARRVVNLRSVQTDRDDLWSFIKLPDAPPVNRLPLAFRFLAAYWRDHDGCH